MSTIKLIHIDEHPIVRTGIQCLLATADEIEIIASVKNVDAFFETIKHIPASFVQVVMIDIYSPSDLEIRRTAAARPTAPTQTIRYLPTVLGLIATASAR